MRACADAYTYSESRTKEKYAVILDLQEKEYGSLLYARQVVYEHILISSV